MEGKQSGNKPDLKEVWLTAIALQRIGDGLLSNYEGKARMGTSQDRRSQVSRANAGAQNTDDPPSRTNQKGNDGGRWKVKTIGIGMV